MDKIKLLTGDSTKLMKQIDSDSVSLIISDPPYNLSKDYNSSKDNMDFNTFTGFTRQWLSEATRILAPGGTIYVFMGMKMISYVYMIMEQELNLDFQSWITWHYTQGMGRTKGYSSRHDDILMFTKPGNKTTFNLDNITVPQKYYRSRNNMRGANPGNVWNFSHIHYSNPNRAVHPTQKPEGIIERMILASSNENDLILDPFSGSGTTLRVAQVTNRKAIGIELDSTFVAETKKRLEEPFEGFDSIDDRMLRVPNDLSKESIRREYFHNHIIWFLTNHKMAMNNFFTNFLEKYKDKVTEDEMNDILLTAENYNVKINSKLIKEISKKFANNITLF